MNENHKYQASNMGSAIGGAAVTGLLTPRERLTGDAVKCQAPLGIRASHVEEQMLNIVSELAGLEKSVEVLAEKTSPVRFDPVAPESADDKCSSPWPMIAPLADNLRGYAYRLTKLRQQLDRIVSTIEV